VKYRFPRLLAAVLFLATAGLTVAVSCGGHARPITQPVPVPDQTDIIWSLLILGDAGAPDTNDPVLGAARRLASVAPDQSTVLFVGDNLYPHGLDAEGTPERPLQELRLKRQIDVGSKSGANVILVPGNHDWQGGRTGGLESIRRQGAFIGEVSGGVAELIPANGCPGPVIRDVGETFRIIALDTQWWLHGNDKPIGLDRGCQSTDEEDIVTRLEAAIATAGARKVVVLGHHPLASGGKHGGHFTVLNHLFPLRDLAPWAWLPLPLVGSIYPIARMSGISPQDVGHGENRRMREALERGMAKGAPLAYVSGHEHTLQVIEGTSARWLLVSGSGYFGHTDHTTWLERTRYAASQSGFMRVDALRSGRIRLGVIVVDADGGEGGAWREAFSFWLE